MHILALAFGAALAVGLCDKSFERIGNPTSAEEGHLGVTGWAKKTGILLKLGTS